MGYLLLKHLHQACALVSITGFVLRGAGALAGAGWARSRAARTLPHVVDTVLLLSAIAMLALAHLNPLQAPWLVAKLGGLLLYIVFGALALRPGKPRSVRGLAWAAALASVAFIVSVALSKSPWGFLQHLAFAPH